MQYHSGFMVTYTRVDGKQYKTYVPPCWMESGPERRQREATDRQRERRAGKIRRYYDALQQRRLGGAHETA